MDPYVGEIRIFAGSYAPVGWEFCNGQLLNIQQYNVLYALLGTVYGGDGVTTFALPDLRGRAALSFGAGTNLSPYALGAHGGYEDLTIDQSQLPAHTHALAANPATAASGSPAGNVPAVANAAFYTPADAKGIKTFDLASASVGPAGATGSHSNTMPSLPLNFIIAMEGLFPQAA
jgi:microcystin-dependent protein